jgi:transformation/transcription domain-associated protein
MALSLSGQVKVSFTRIPTSRLTPGQADYEEEFINETPKIPILMQRIQRWRDKYEKILESRPRFQTLDVLSHYLTEFQYSKVDDIEVFGQYTEVRANKCRRNCS